MSTPSTSNPVMAELAASLTAAGLPCTVEKGLATEPKEGFVFMPVPTPKKVASVANKLGMAGLKVFRVDVEAKGQDQWIVLYYEPMCGEALSDERRAALLATGEKLLRRQTA